MYRVSCRTFIIACAATLVAGGNSALARPSHNHHRSIHASVHHHEARHHVYRQARRHHVRRVRQVEQQPELNAYYSGPGSAQTYAVSDTSGAYNRRGRVWRARYRHQMRDGAAPVASFGGGALVADARRYIGTNPTGRASLWCGAFMDMVLKQTGHKGGGNLALGYLHYGRRVAGPQVGAIAVMGRRGGGHVGVVSGIDANGNPIIVSGNHNHTVAESVYPRSRIEAYVLPN